MYLDIGLVAVLAILVVFAVSAVFGFVVKWAVFIGLGIVIGFVLSHVFTSARAKLALAEVFADAEKMATSFVAASPKAKLDAIWGKAVSTEKTLVVAVEEAFAHLETLPPALGDLVPEPAVEEVPAPAPAAEVIPLAPVVTVASAAAAALAAVVAPEVKAA